VDLKGPPGSAFPEKAQDMIRIPSATLDPLAEKVVMPVHKVSVATGSFQHRPYGRGEFRGYDFIGVQGEYPLSAGSAYGKVFVLVETALAVSHGNSGTEALGFFHGIVFAPVVNDHDFIGKPDRFEARADVEGLIFCRKGHTE
jgi:hypothetical protein